jgi:hypothetical protein
MSLPESSAKMSHHEDVGRRHLAIVLGVLASFVSCPSAFAADGQSAAYIAQLAELQTLDRTMLSTQGTPDGKAAHDTLGIALQKLADSPEIAAHSKDPQIAELAKLQATLRLLAASVKTPETYAKVHETLEGELKALAAEQDIKGSLKK